MTVLLCSDIAKAANLGPGIRKGHDIAYSCVIHQDGNNPNLEINPEKNCWICRVCNIGGNAWELAAACAGVKPDNKPAVSSWLHEHGLLNGNGHGPEKQVKAWQRIWNSTIPMSSPDAELGRCYLEKRGLYFQAYPADMRFTSSLDYYEGKTQTGQHPGIVFLVRDRNRNSIGIQRIYLTSQGQKADVPQPKKALGSISGGAIYFDEIRDSLNVVEGPETGLAVFLATQMPTCSTVSASGMAKLQIPEGVQTVDIWPDLDVSEAGQKAAGELAQKAHAEGKTVYLRLPAEPIPEGEKSRDWLDVFNHEGPDAFQYAMERDEPWSPEDKKPGTDQARDEKEIPADLFFAFMPTHQYIFSPDRSLWPASSVNSRVRIFNKAGQRVKANEWLDRNRPVEQLTWAPGKPMVIEGQLVVEGGWIKHAGFTCFNLYRPPLEIPGQASQAGKWLEHIERIYPNDAEHIILWLAHRVQRPWEKINHALVLGGLQGIGKDTLLDPVKHGVGPWNFFEISPTHLLGRFNGFVKSVILRISEARDLGMEDRFKFYDHLKVYTAAPPDVLRCDEKHLRECSVLNLCGVIITTNYKTGGIYLPADDRRHYVAWSDLSQKDFNNYYWQELYKWYDSGGIGHVVAYLKTMDISGFDPKAPPAKTAAFWSIVDASRAPEDAELADAIEALGNPSVFTVNHLLPHVEIDFKCWLQDRKNAKILSHRIDSAGYEAVRNPNATDGRWMVDGKKQTVYARKDICDRDRIIAAMDLRGGY